MYAVVKSAYAVVKSVRLHTPWSSLETAMTSRMQYSSRWAALAPGWNRRRAGAAKLWALPIMLQAARALEEVHAKVRCDFHMHATKWWNHADSCQLLLGVRHPRSEAAQHFCEGAHPKGATDGDVG